MELLYQEQVMQIAQTLSGFSAGEADILVEQWARRKELNWKNKNIILLKVLLRME